jgi:transcriptional regulator with XRE-family HTH domain
LRRLRLGRGWTQEELAQRAGVGLSSLKALESGGKGTLLRFLQVASALGVVDELGGLFSESRVAESLDALERTQRQRAPRQKRKEDDS